MASRLDGFKEKIEEAKNENDDDSDGSRTISETSNEEDYVFQSS
jgi:hypothetical protein